MTSRTMLRVSFGSRISTDVAPRDSSRMTTCLSCLLAALSALNPQGFTTTDFLGK